MSIRVAYEEVKKNVKQAFLNLGLTEEQAETCASNSYPVQRRRR